MNTTHIVFPSNRIVDIERTFYLRLAPLYEFQEIRQMLLLLFEEYFGWDTAKYLLHRQETVDQSQLLRFHWALDSLEQGRPIQQVIGSTTFCGCRIKVTPDVLIPRPETEELVSMLPSLCSAGVDSVLDLCTGSGCVAVALAKHFPRAQVTAVDISEKAISVARENAEGNGVEVTFVHDDLLRPAGDWADRSYGLIVSNPPYVRQCERAAMRRNVLDYEPELALFVPDNNPLLFYDAIGEVAAKSLSPKGILAVEINEAYGEETCQLLAEKGFQAELHHDFRGKPRFVIASFSSR